MAGEIFSLVQHVHAQDMRSLLALGAAAVSDPKILQREY
jgi:hypothetical protein